MLILLQWIEEPTLLVTRFEYANVFHTFTDWYSAYVSSRVTGLPSRPHVIFVDGHSKVLILLCTSPLYIFHSLIFDYIVFVGPSCIRLFVTYLCPCLCYASDRDFALLIMIC